MHLPILASNVWDEFAMGFGVAAALLAVGGIVLLRFQRNRNQFALMRAALEKGISDFSGGQPAWLVSFRQGLMMLTLGVGLIAVGTGAWVLGDSKATSLSMATTQPASLSGPKPRDERGRLTAEGRQYSMTKDRWQWAQTEELAGKCMVGSGIILVLLGAVRMGFARAERKYLTDPQD
ncbi:MAG TPA: hypothetical protein VHP11_02575 [Tepidisphaeraceae bacterium]|nr:hypothetical protein [Tepidisphaeraceae bacterium]